MRIRNGLQVAILGILAWGFAPSPTLAQSQGGSPTVSGTGATPEMPATLQETLETGLYARRPQEFAFLASVAQRVEDGELDVDLVNQAFDWARKKRRYRIQFFENALRALAKRRGVVL